MVGHLHLIIRICICHPKGIDAQEGIMCKNRGRQIGAQWQRDTKKGFTVFILPFRAQPLS